MSTTTELEIHRKCERLVYKFLNVLESEQAKVADFFTEHGEAFGIIGRDAIRARFAEIEAVDDNVNVNICSNLVIDVDSEYHARATNYVIHYVADRITEELTDPEGAQVEGELQPARSITRWSWEFMRVEDEWLISKLHYPEPTLLRKDVLDAL